MELARVLQVVHSSNCVSWEREGEWARVDGQLWTAELGRGLSLDLQQLY
jgi:hypothetical protein